MRLGKGWALVKLGLVCQEIDISRAQTEGTPGWADPESTLDEPCQASRTLDEP